MSTVQQLRALVGHRGRILIQSGFWSLVAKTCAAANLFLAIPFVLGALDLARFGAWATLASLVAFSGFLDFGLGNGAMNLMAAAHGRGDDRKAALVHREAWRTLWRVATVLAVLIAVLLPTLPWYRLLGLPAELAGEAMVAASFVMAAVACSVPLNLALRAQLAFGRGDRAFRLQALGQLSALAAVVAMAHWHATLPALAAAAVVPPVLASLANTIQFSSDPLLQDRSSRPGDDPRATRAAIRGEGSLFFVLQASAALAFSADLLLISSIRGAAEAGPYAVLQRVFSFIPLALSLAWNPMWPLYRQSLAMGDHAWVAKTLRRSLLLASAFAATCSAVVLLAYRPAMQWLDSSMEATYVLLLGFATWSILEALGTAMATFFNSASVLRFQLICSGGFALSCFSAKAWAIHAWGSTVVPWVTIATYLVFCVLPAIVFWPRIWDEAKRRRY